MPYVGNLNIDITTKGQVNNGAQDTSFGLQIHSYFFLIQYCIKRLRQMLFHLIQSAIISCSQRSFLPSCSAILKIVLVAEWVGPFLIGSLFCYYVDDVRTCFNLIRTQAFQHKEKISFFLMSFCSCDVAIMSLCQDVHTAKKRIYIEYYMMGTRGYEFYLRLFNSILLYEMSSTQTKYRGNDFLD